MGNRALFHANLLHPPYVPGCARSRSRHFQAICSFRYNAIVILATIPAFIITLIFQRQIAEGTASSVFKSHPIGATS